MGRKKALNTSSAFSFIQNGQLRGVGGGASLYVHRGLSTVGTCVPECEWVFCQYRMSPVHVCLCPCGLLASAARVQAQQSGLPWSGRAEPLYWVSVGVGRGVCGQRPWELGRGGLAGGFGQD